MSDQARRDPGWESGDPTPPWDRGFRWALGHFARLFGLGRLARLFRRPARMKTLNRRGK